MRHVLSYMVLDKVGFIKFFASVAHLQAGSFRTMVLR